MRSSLATLLLVAAAVVPAVGQTGMAPVNDLPNPYQPAERSWARLPDGRAWGSTAGIDIGPKGEIWAIDRCGLNTCEGSDVPTVHQIDPASGKVLRSIGAGLFVFPHGMHVDRDGNIWVTDGQASKDGKKGHQVLKLSPEGKVLMRLGKAGQRGGGPDMFDEPCDVVTAPNGDIFVSDGHAGQQATATATTASRIVKYSRDGTFIKSFGRWGAAPGELKTPHAMVIDARGRLIVADRGNMRIQIYDLDGNLQDSWAQFSRVSGLFIDQMTRSTRSIRKARGTIIPAGEKAHASVRRKMARSCTSCQGTRQTIPTAPQVKALRSTGMARFTRPKTRCGGLPGISANRRKRCTLYR